MTWQVRGDAACREEVRKGEKGRKQQLLVQEGTQELKSQVPPGDTGQALGSCYSGKDT